MKGEHALTIVIDEAKHITRKDIEDAFKRMKQLGWNTHFSTQFIEAITDPDPNAKEKVSFD